MRTILLIVFLVCFSCTNPVGEQFEDFGGVVLSKNWSDWVIVGRFGAGGPFKVTDITACDINMPCSFIHNGQKHTYGQFYGYRITILRLEDALGAENHLVLRSKE